MTEITITQSDTIVTATVNGEVLAQSDKAQLLKEGAYPPVWYFPKSDIKMDGLKASDKTTVCPFKGTANYWHLDFAGKTSENGAWAYEDPIDAADGIKGHIAFYPFVADIKTA